LRASLITRGLACAVPLALLLYDLWLHQPFYVDDAFISLRYADRFLHGHGLTWNDGEAVEGYSNFLWVLLVSALGFFGTDLVLATKILGLACTLGAFATIAHYARALPAYITFLGLSVFSTSASVAIWSMSGMETPLVMLLLAWAVIMLLPLLSAYDGKRTVRVGILLGLLCWARPEGAMFTICFAAGLLLFSRVGFAARLKMLVILCAIPLGFFCAQLAFRLYYYHEWTANSALAKLSFSRYHTYAGLDYARDALISFLPVIAYILLNLRLARDTWRPNGLLLLIIAVLTTAIIFTGGDIFSNGYRFFVPLVPLIALLFMHGARAGFAAAGWLKESVLLCVVGISQLALQLYYPPHLDTGIHGLTQAWVEMGKALEKRFGPYQPLVATPAAGAIPYYSKLPSIDAFGLNDAYLTGHRFDEKMHFGSKMIGHELFDPDYIKMRRPDILMFDTPGLPTFCEQTDCHDLLNDYRVEELAMPQFKARIWVRKDSTRLGATN